MRVLVTAVPAWGHIGPVLPLGRALSAAGHDVRVATHADRHELIAAAGLTAVSAGMTEIDMVTERPRRMPETVGRPNVEWAYRMFIEIMAPVMRADLSSFAASWRPGLIIHEEGEYAGPVVATELGVRWLTHGWGSPLPPIEDLRRLEQAAGPLWHDAGLDVAPAAGLYAHGLIDPCPPFLQAERPRVSVAWPVRPEPVYQSELADDLDFNPPARLAYVGFGTVPLYANAPTQVAMAVDACVSRGFRTVVTTTDEALRDQLQSAHGAQVVVRDFVSLAGLFGRCDVAVCHGGAGTVLAALSAGVPLVLLPRGAPSQLRMAAACQASGVAVIPDATSVRALANAVDAATTNASRERARDARRRISSMPPASELVTNVEELVRV